MPSSVILTFAGFRFAMNDALLVGGVERLGDLAGDREGPQQYSMRAGPHPHALPCLGSQTRSARRPQALLVPSQQ